MPNARKRIFRAFILTIVLAVTAPSINLAQTDCAGESCSKDVPRDASTLRFGYTQFPPYAWTNTSGVAEGYMIDLIRIVLEPQGFSIRFVPHDNPSQMLESLSGGAIDATTPLSISPERQAFGLFSQPVHTFNFTVFTLSEGPRISGASGLSGLRVGVSDGSQASALVQRIDGAIPIPLESGADLILPLLKGQVDAVVAPEETILHTVKLAELGDRVVRAPVSLGSASAGFLIDARMSNFARELDIAIDLATANGNVSALRSSWFAPGRNPLTPREGILLVFSGLAVLLALAFGGWSLYRGQRLHRGQGNLAELLQDSLNSAGVAVLLSDEGLKPIWWNAAYSAAFPKEVQALRNGDHLGQVIDLSSANACSEVSSSHEEELETARQVVDLLKEAESTSIFGETVDGRILRSSYMMLPSGDMAILSADVTVLTKKKEEAERTSNELRDANRQLREFSNLAAHDLAGPLRSIQNLHSWIREDLTELGVELGVDTESNFEHIDRLINKQRALIQDLLAYSNADQLSKNTEFDPLERLDSIIDLSSLPSGMNVSTPLSMPRLRGDPIGFDIVLRNLISNAGKHHDREIGKIDISLNRIDGFAKISVRDDGPGIEAKYKDKVFEPFQSFRTKEHGGGTGLGLSFVARAVATWGGSVSLSSDPIARETIFSFTVPLAETRVSDGKVVRMRASA